MLLLGTGRFRRLALARGLTSGVQPHGCAAELPVDESHGRLDLGHSGLAATMRRMSCEERYFVLGIVIVVGGAQLQRTLDKVQYQDRPGWTVSSPLFIRLVSNTRRSNK